MQISWTSNKTKWSLKFKTKGQLDRLSLKGQCQNSRCNIITLITSIIHFKFLAWAFDLDYGVIQDIYNYQLLLKSKWESKIWQRDKSFADVKENLFKKRGKITNSIQSLRKHNQANHKRPENVDKIDIKSYNYKIWDSIVTGSPINNVLILKT